MHTIDEVKQELIEHLYSLDKTKMSVSELRTYADTDQVAFNIAKSDKDDMFLEIFKTINSGAGFNRAAATKEDG